jgi:hypothetical protein
MQREELYQELFGNLDEAEPDAESEVDDWQIVNEGGAAEADSEFRPLPWESGGEPWSSHDGAHRNRSQASARAASAVASPRGEYRRLRRVVDPSSVGAAASSASLGVAASVDVAPVIVAKAKPVPRRTPYQVRYYAVSSVSSTASQKCPLAPGVYCGIWRDVELLVPGRNLVGSGVSLQGFDTLDEAIAHLTPPSRRRAFRFAEEVIIKDRDQVADLIQNFSSD